MSTPKKPADVDMLPEYDFSKAVRGKYYERFKQASNVVVLDDDVAKLFPNAEAVNGALPGARHRRHTRPQQQAAEHPRQAAKQTDAADQAGASEEASPLISVLD